MGYQIFYQTLEILVESALLGVKNNMLVCNGEETLVIIMLTLFQLTVHALFGAFDSFKLFLAFFQCGIVDVFLGAYHRIENIHLSDTHKIAEYPVCCNACTYKKSQIQRQCS